MGSMEIAGGRLQAVEGRAQSGYELRQTRDRAGGEHSKDLGKIQKREGSVFVALEAERQAANRSWMRGARVERCGRLQNAKRKDTLDAAFLFGSHCMAPEQAAALGASGKRRMTGSHLMRVDYLDH